MSIAGGLVLSVSKCELLHCTGTENVAAIDNRVGEIEIARLSRDISVDILTIYQVSHPGTVYLYNRTTVLTRSKYSKQTLMKV